MPHVTSCPLGGGQGSCCPVPASTQSAPSLTQSAPSEGHPLPPTALGGQKQPVFCLQFATSPSSWQRTPSLGRQQAAPSSSPWGFSDGKYGLCTGADKESPSALHSQAEEMSWGPCSTQKPAAQCGQALLRWGHPGWPQHGAKAQTCTLAMPDQGSERG